MSKDFIGLLRSPLTPNTTLRVSFVFSEHTLEIFNDLVFIGRWPNRALTVERSTGDWLKLHLDDNEWDFLPEDPTGFFLAAPLTSAHRTKPPKEPAVSAKASQSALGAMLAVLLVSVGIVMGRYQLDGSLLSVAITLVLAATLGGWWAATQGHKLRELLRSDQRAQKLRHDRTRRVLRVQDVLQDPTAHVANLPRSHDSESNEHQPTRSDRERIDPSGDEHKAVPSAGFADEIDLNKFEEDSVEGGAPIDSADIPTGRSHAGVESADDAASERWIDVRYIEERHFDEAILRRVAEVQNSSHVIDDVDTDRAEDSFGPAVPPSLAVKRYLEAVENGSAPPNADATLLEGEEPANSAPAGANAGASSSDPDISLTEIHGIGPALSETLQHLGVRDVHDLALLDSDDLDYLEQEMGHFGSRIRSQHWVEQARRLVGLALE